MDASGIRALLESIRSGETAVDTAVEKLRFLSYEDLGYAKIDHHRALRTGFPEVIYCEGKTISQIQSILSRMMEQGEANILATRAAPEVYEAVRNMAPEVEYHEAARIVVFHRQPITIHTPDRKSVV